MRFVKRQCLEQGNISMLPSQFNQEAPSGSLGVFHILSHNGCKTELMIQLYFDDEEESHPFFPSFILHTCPAQCF